jgi:hypothetical protein
MTARGVLARQVFSSTPQTVAKNKARAHRNFERLLMAFDMERNESDKGQMINNYG